MSPTKWNSRAPAARPTTVFSRSLDGRERRPRTGADHNAADDPLDPEPDDEVEPDAWDEADALAAMPWDEAYKMLRADIDAVRAGTLPSMADAEAAKDAKSPKDRLWSKRRRRRDRYGRTF